MEEKDKKKPPEYLYRFMRFNTNAIKSLVRKEFYFASLSELNDPTDCAIPLEVECVPEADTEEYSLLHNRFQKLPDEQVSISPYFLSKTSEVTKQVVKDLFRHKVSKEYGVLSFSHSDKVLKDQTMWTHYADHSKGFCLKFKRQKLIDNNNVIAIDNYYVDYKKRHPSYRINVRKELLVDRAFIMDNSYFFNKTDNWVKECEYRYVLPLWQMNRNINDPSLRLRSFFPEKLEAVYFGEKMTYDNKDTLCKILRSVEGYSANIKYYYCYWDFMNSEIRIK